MDVNHPGSQENVISSWEPAHSLEEDAVSGAEIAPCLPALAVSCLPRCLWWEKGPVQSWLALLWYLLNLLFCEQARLCLRAFRGKVLSFFFSLSLAIPQFGLLTMLSPSDCPQSIQTWFLPYMQPVPPCPAFVCWWWM